MTINIDKIVVDYDEENGQDHVTIFTGPDGNQAFYGFIDDGEVEAVDYGEYDEDGELVHTEAIDQFPEPELWRELEALGFHVVA